MGTQVVDAFFEDFVTRDRFDICLFAESFHYIDLVAALAKAADLADRGVVIFDYFRRPGFAHGDGTRGTHSEFVSEVERQGVFRILSDDDMTDAITPTFVIHEHLKNDKIAPFVDRFRSELRREYPWRAWAVEKMLGRTMDKLGRRTNRAEKFASEHEHRLIVLARADQAA